MHQRGDWQGVGELMLSSARKLEKGGADFLICPDNTVHQAFPHVKPRSPRPTGSTSPTSSPTKRWRVDSAASG